MRKYSITIYSLFLMIFIMNASCDSRVKKIEEQKEDGVIIGTINDIKTSANLTISLDKVAKFMQEDNRLTLERFNYAYTRAWVEVIEVEQDKYSYYLGVEADLESKNNEKVYSYYAIYTKLDVNNSKLLYNQNSIQHSCTGKCCDNCKLVLFKNNLGCKCDIPTNNQDCTKKAKCKHDISEKLTKEQKINEII